MGVLTGRGELRVYGSDLNGEANRAKMLKVQREVHDQSGVGFQRGATAGSRLLQL